MATKVTILGEQPIEQIIQELALLSDEQGQRLLKLIMEYGTKRWVEGFNKASDISGYGTPPEPTVRNEVRNAPIVNNQIGQL